MAQAMSPPGAGAIPVRQRTGSYGVIGPYGNGVWLVVKNGKAILSNRSGLPPQGTGYQYYYLGSNAQTASARLLDALPKFNLVTTDTANFVQMSQSALEGKQVPLPGPGPNNILASIKNGLRAGVFFAPPSIAGALSGGAAAGEAAAGGAAAEGGAAGAAATGAAGGIGAMQLAKTAALIGGTADFLSWIAWIFHPVNILRTVEFIAGGILMAMGIHALIGRTSAGVDVSRISKELASATPLGRAQRMARGRRMGRKEGEIEHARLEGRRETRSKLSQQSARRTQERGRRRSARARGSNN